MLAPFLIRGGCYHRATLAMPPEYTKVNVGNGQSRLTTREHSNAIASDGCFVPLLLAPERGFGEWRGPQHSQGRRCSEKSIDRNAQRTGSCCPNPAALRHYAFADL